MHHSKGIASRTHMHSLNYLLNPELNFINSHSEQAVKRLMIMRDHEAKFLPITSDVLSYQNHGLVELPSFSTSCQGQRHFVAVWREVN